MLRPSSSIGRRALRLPGRHRLELARDLPHGAVVTPGARGPVLPLVLHHRHAPLERVPASLATVLVRSHPQVPPDRRYPALPVSFVNLRTILSPQPARPLRSAQPSLRAWARTRPASSMATAHDSSSAESGGIRSFRSCTCPFSRRTARNEPRGMRQPDSAQHVPAIPPRSLTAGEPGRTPGRPWSGRFGSRSSAGWPAGKSLSISGTSIQSPARPPVRAGASSSGESRLRRVRVSYRTGVDVDGRGSV